LTCTTTAAWRQGPALSIGPNRVGFYPRTETSCFLNKIGMMDNVQKEVYFNNTPLSQTFRFKLRKRKFDMSEKHMRRKYWKLLS
jgi:hypothetical protein